MNGDKKYCFTEQEFWALAGSVGIQKLYGFLPEAEADLKKFDEKIVYQLLFQMTNKKFLEAEENRYRMHPELRELFGYIKSASGVLTIYSMSGSFSNKCIYLSDNIVLVEEGGINARFLKACFGAREDILDIALEGILPKQNVADDLLYQKENADLEKLQDKELVIFLEQMGSQEEQERKKVIEGLGIHSRIEKWEKEVSCAVKSLWIAVRPLYNLLLYQEKEEWHIYFYSLRKLKELIEEMIGDD